MESMEKLTSAPYGSITLPGHEDTEVLVSMATTEIGRAMVVRELTRYWHAANSNTSATPYRKLYQAALIDLEAPIPTGAIYARPVTAEELDELGGNDPD